MLQIDKIIKCNEWLQDTEDFAHSSSISWLIDQMSKYCRSLAFVNNQMAEAKQALNMKKVDAYKHVINSNSFDAPASVIKDYVNSLIYEDQYHYDLCERTSRTLVHLIDALRTAISALKVEAQYNYGQT